MNVYELRVPGASDPRRLAAIRWELFFFPEVRGIFATVRPDAVAVLYEGERPAPAAWVRALRAGGYAADDLEATGPEELPRPAA